MRVTFIKILLCQEKFAEQRNLDVFLVADANLKKICAPFLWLFRCTLIFDTNFLGSKSPAQGSIFSVIICIFKFDAQKEEFSNFA